MMISGAVVEKQLNRKSSEKNVIDLLDCDSLLENFCGSGKAAIEFKKKYFQKQPVVYKNNDIDNVKEMLFDLHVPTMLKSSASDQIHVWMRQIDLATLATITVDDSDQAYKLYNAGHSLYCRAPLDIEKLVVPALLKDLGLGVGGSNNDRFRRGEIETFYSRKGHTTDFHTDFQENFTIQLTGRKKWTFTDSTAVHPLRGCTPHFNDRANKEVVEQQVKVLQLADPSFRADQFRVSSSNSDISSSNAQQQQKEYSVILEAGDVMYHPAGVWHRVECTEDSIAINVSLTVASYADVFCSSLHQLLLENPLWRSPVITDGDINATRGGGARSVMQSLMRRLPDLLHGLTASDLLPTPCLNINDTQALHYPKQRSGSDSGASGLDEQDEEDGDEFEEVAEGEEDNDDDDDENKDTEEESSGAPRETVIRVSAFDHSSYYERWFQPDDEAEQDQRCMGKKQQRLSVEERRSRTVDRITANCSLKLNPLAMILSSDDLQTCGAWAAPLLSSNDEEGGPAGTPGVSHNNSNSYVVHCGFGNETLESLSRVVITDLPNEIQPVMTALLGRYRAMRAGRVSHYHQNDTTRSKDSNYPSLPKNDAFSVSTLLKVLGGCESGSNDPNKKQKVGEASSNSAIVSSTMLDAKEGVIRLMFALHAAGALTVNNL